MKHSARAEDTYMKAKEDPLSSRETPCSVEVAKKIVNAEHEKVILDFIAGKQVQGKFSECTHILKGQDPFYQRLCMIYLTSSTAGL